MAFKRILPIVQNNQQHTLKKPSLYRACIMNNKAEYERCEMKIIQLYKKINGVE